MIIKLISNTNVDKFNEEIQDMIDKMESENNVLVDIKYKPLVKHSDAIVYTILLFFTNPYKEQSKISSLMNMATPTRSFL